MHNFLSDALLNLFSAATPARPLNQLFNPLTFAIAVVSANLVAGDGAREVPSCQQQAGVGAGTSGSAKAKAKPGMTTVSVRWQLLLTLGLEQGAPGRRPRRWNLELLLSAKVALFPLIIAEWTKWQGLMWALETLGRSTSRHHQHNNPLLPRFHV